MKRESLCVVKEVCVCVCVCVCVRERERAKESVCILSFDVSGNDV